MPRCFVPRLFFTYALKRCPRLWVRAIQDLIRVHGYAVGLNLASIIEGKMKRRVDDYTRCGQGWWHSLCISDFPKKITDMQQTNLILYSLLLKIRASVRCFLSRDGLCVHARYPCAPLNPSCSKVTFNVIALLLHGLDSNKLVTIWIKG